MSDDKLNPFKIAQQQLDETAKILNLEPVLHELLRWPMREIHVLLPVKMDSGKTKIFKGFRVQYNDARGPCKGGIRFHPEETIDTVRALAAWMTWKTALLGLPFGGGKGGVICNPKELSETELERICRAYIDQLAFALGSDKDIPAPDVYTNPQIMAWMLDEFQKIKGSHDPGMITGKPLSIGGSQGREDATGRGALYVIKEAAKLLKMDLKKCKVAIQGFGNAGYFLAKLCPEILGAKVIAVSDSKGGIVLEQGLDADKVMEHKRKNGSVDCFPNSRKISNAELLELDVDILIPAALENVVTKENAGKIRAKLLAETANGPTTPEADEILYKNNVFVIPDFLCNAGGVTVSYFEWVQNVSGLYWEEEEVHKRLEEKMVKAFNSVVETAGKYKVNNRMGAYIVAVSRVAEAMKARGWV